MIFHDIRGIYLYMCSVWMPFLWQHNNDWPYHEGAQKHVDSSNEVITEYTVHVYVTRSGV